MKIFSDESWYWCTALVLMPLNWCWYTHASILLFATVEHIHLHRKTCKVAVLCATHLWKSVSEMHNVQIAQWIFGEIIFKLFFLFDLTLLPLVNQVPVGYRGGSTQQSCVSFIIEISQIGNKFQWRKVKGTFPLSHCHTVTLSHCHGLLSKLQGNSHNN